MLTYEVTDYKYPSVKVITDLVTRYADSQYNFFNAIKWFERFNPGIYGVHQVDAYAYLKKATDDYKELQVEFLYQLASLSDEELLQTQKPEEIFKSAIAKRNEFIKRLDEEIRKNGHTKECGNILTQIQRYFEKMQVASEKQQLILSFEEFLSHLRSVKGASAMASRSYTRKIDSQIEDIALQYAGENNMIEWTSEALRNNKERAQQILRGIFENEQLRADFVGFLKNHQTQNSYRNRATPLYIAAANWLSGKPLNDRSFIETNPGLFEGNDTIAQHAWYGASIIAHYPILDERELSLPKPQKKKIKILLPGSGETLRPRSSQALYLKTILQQIPDRLDIEITATDISFPELAHIFDEHGAFTGQTKRELAFNGDGIYYDGKHNIKLCRVDKPSRDICSGDFASDEKYDLIICSRLAIEYEYDIEKRHNLRRNLLNLLSNDGLFLYDTEDARQAEIIYRDINGRVAVLKHTVPYKYIDSDGRSTDEVAKILGTPVAEEDKRILDTAYRLSDKYATRRNTARDRILVSRLFYAADQDFIRAIAAMVSDVPDEIIRNSFKEFGKDITDRIIRERKELSIYRQILPDGKWVNERNIYSAKLEPVELPAGMPWLQVFRCGLYNIFISSSSTSPAEGAYVLINKMKGDRTVESRAFLARDTAASHEVSDLPAQKTASPGNYLAEGDNIINQLFLWAKEPALELGLNVQSAIATLNRYAKLRAHRNIDIIGMIRLLEEHARTKDITDTKCRIMHL